ncbi:hypothetical protein GCM10007079_31860 [Nocardiopsis terrae]|uniref:Catechol 2,3-dioxygenase-like lactoylglutathione lyase family enzyme n=1 Tax=Nocardiopsis terrae TaxID=372655 RepID=A0ABR9HJ07_9ACTN|nr:hypothetical protein [Nocardiopsis terrae]MBE1459007.1 catechol 2,3-dioxygenase-like lactoylglutathione lyase family enzyme [Nocardiopsis terrae]GHC87584.1 hypothetical protein GCM10007079_31860 [Nocardiopsis terrae]
MFDSTRAFGSFVAPDTETARTFYCDTLGLNVEDVPGMEEGIAREGKPFVA